MSIVEDVFQLIYFLLIPCQRYLEQFAANLEGLITHLQDSLNKNTTGTSWSVRGKALFQEELLIASITF